MEKWDACNFAVNEDDLEGRVCYGGLDLSSTTDITAFVLVFPPLDEDDKYIVLPYFWVPEDTLDLRVRRDHVPYDLWERKGYLQTTEGNVVHYGYIENFIESLGERFNIREIAFDRWGAVQMVQNLEGMGFTVVPFGQGFKDMSPPTKELMKLVLEQKIAHGGHPVLRWNMDNIFIRTKKGAKWTGGTINGILTNEKYIGDALFQKTITDANFKRKRNYGEEEQYYCEDHHEPIIDRETFEKAREAIRQRGLEKGNCTEDTSKYQNRYAMSGKIKCGECGRSFKRRYHYTSHGKSYNAWCCGGHLEDSKSCSMKFIRDDDLKRTFLTMMNKLVFGNDLVLKPLLISITTNNSKKNANSVEDIEKEMESNEEQRKQLNTLLTNGYLERPVFAEAHNKLIMEYEHLVAKRDLLFRMDDAGYTMEQALKELVDFLNDAKPFTEWEESLFERFIEKVKVLSREKIEFEFKCGLKLKERID